MNNIEQWIAEIRADAYYFNEKPCPPDLAEKVKEHLLSLGLKLEGTMREWIHSGVNLLFSGDPWASHYFIYIHRLLESPRSFGLLEGGEGTFLKIGVCEETSILLSLDGTNRIFGEAWPQGMGTVAVPVGSFDDFLTLVLDDIKLGVVRVAFARELEPEYFEGIQPWRVPRELHPRTFYDVVQEIINEFIQGAV